MVRDMSTGQVSISQRAPWKPGWQTHPPNGEHEPCTHEHPAHDPTDLKLLRINDYALNIGKNEEL